MERGSLDALFETDQTTVGHVHILGAGIWYPGVQHALLSDVPETLQPPQRRIEPPGLRRIEPPPDPDDAEKLALLNAPLRERPTDLTDRELEVVSEVVSSATDYFRALDSSVDPMEFIDRTRNAIQRLNLATGCLRPERVDAILAAANHELQSSGIRLERQQDGDSFNIIVGVFNPRRGQMVVLETIRNRPACGTS